MRWTKSKTWQTSRCRGTIKHMLTLYKTHLRFLLPKWQVWRGTASVMSWIRKDVCCACSGVSGDESDELVLLNVCWSLKRWSVCVGHWRTETHKLLMNSLTAQCQVQAVSWTLCLPPMNQCDISSDSQSHHSKHSQPWNISHIQPKHRSSE